MLDINHPRAKIIFEVARYLDLIKICCQQAVRQSSAHRIPLFLKAVDAYEKLACFSEMHYSSKWGQLTVLLAELNKELELVFRKDSPSAANHCQLCSSKLMVVFTGSKENNQLSYCEHCLSKVEMLLEQLEDPLETRWIR